MRDINSRTVFYFILLGIGIYLLFTLFRGDTAAFGSLGSSKVLVWLYIAVGFLVAIDVHEFGHAFVADRLGDRTPRYQGRVTLNPIRHLDPFGSLMIVMTVASGIGIGWGRPVQINPSQVKSGRNGLALISVAGVLANLVTAAVVAAILHSGVLAHGVPFAANLQQLLFTVAGVNILLAVFNFLVPLPPLDGFNFLVNVLPLRWAWQLRQLERFGPMLLLLLILGSQMGILFVNPLTYLVGYPTHWLSGALGLA